MAHFPKPAAGSWTENWPELGTAPVNYEDSIDPEHFKLEQEAIFFGQMLQHLIFEFRARRSRFITNLTSFSLRKILFSS